MMQERVKNEEKRSLAQKAKQETDKRRTWSEQMVKMITASEARLNVDFGCIRKLMKKCRVQCNVVQ